MKNTKKRLEKKSVKNIKIFMKGKRIRCEIRPDKDIKVLLKKKKEKGFSITRNISRSYLSVQEIIT